MFEPKKLAKGIDVHDTMENIFLVVIYLPPFKLWKNKIGYKPSNKKMDQKTRTSLL